MFSKIGVRKLGLEMEKGLSEIQNSHEESCNAGV
jgi:hypothetical protein